MAFVIPLRKKVNLRQRLRAARLGCFVQGFSVSCWAPLIPFIEDSLSLGNAKISLIILIFGAGSVLGMFLAGVFTESSGPRAVYVVSSLLIATAIILISQIPGFWKVAALVLFLGIGVGALDVFGSIYGAYLEKHYRIKVIGPIYALYSLGEILGAGVIVLMLSLRLEISEAVPAVFFIILIAVLWYIPAVDRRLEDNDKKQKISLLSLLPRGAVIYLSLIAAFIFMTGGAMVDWSGLFLTQEAAAPLEYASMGYILVSLAMFVMRIHSNALVKLLGERRLLLGGCLLTAAGLVGAALSTYYLVSLIFFVLAGLGMGNITPLCVRACTRQQTMPFVAAVASVSIMGYAALLLGPALLGYTANHISLQGVFLVLALLCVGAALFAHLSRHLFSRRR